MPAKSSLLGDREIVDGAPLIELVSTVDDFAVKVSCPQDKRFWVRIQREVECSTLVVTDFNPGDRSVEDLVAGLLVALRAFGDMNIRRLVFRDLVPSGDQSPDFPVKVVHAADLAKRLGAVVAAHIGVKSQSFDMESRRGKIDGIITFAAIAAV